MEYGMHSTLEALQDVFPAVSGDDDIPFPVVRVQAPMPRVRLGLPGTLLARIVRLGLPGPDARLHVSLLIAASGLFRAARCDQEQGEPHRE
jgi:hypothetical protein